MSVDVDTGRNNNRDVIWLEDDNSIEMPLSPVTSEYTTTNSETTSSQETSQETSIETSIETSHTENQVVNRYIPPSPLSENETINPFVMGSINNILDNCNTSVVPFRDNTNNIIGIVSNDLQQFELDCPICFDALDTCDVITMDCCKKQIHLKCINRWHIKNINSDTRELCIMCRTKSTLMSDIYNTVRLTIDDEDDEDEEYDFIRNPAIRRRRRINRGTPRPLQHAFCALVFLFSLLLFILLLNGNILVDDEPDYNRTTRYHH